MEAGHAAQQAEGSRIPVFTSTYLHTLKAQDKALGQDLGNGIIDQAITATELYQELQDTQRGSQAWQDTAKAFCNDAAYWRTRAEKAEAKLKANYLEPDPVDQSGSVSPLWAGAVNQAVINPRKTGILAWRGYNRGTEKNHVIWGSVRRYEYYGPALCGLIAWYTVGEHLQQPDCKKCEKALRKLMGIEDVE